MSRLSDVLLVDGVRILLVLSAFVILLQEYYTVHGVDASFVAKEIFKSEGALRYFGQGNITYNVL